LAREQADRYEPHHIADQHQRREREDLPPHQAQHPLAQQRRAAVDPVIHVERERRRVQLWHRAHRVPRDQPVVADPLEAQVAERVGEWDERARAILQLGVVGDVAHLDVEAAGIQHVLEVRHQARAIGPAEVRATPVEAARRLVGVCLVLLEIAQPGQQGAAGRRAVGLSRREGLRVGFVRARCIRAEQEHGGEERGESGAHGGTFCEGTRGRQGREMGDGARRSARASRRRAAPPKDDRQAC